MAFRDDYIDADRDESLMDTPEDMMSEGRTSDLTSGERMAAAQSGFRERLSDQRDATMQPDSSDDLADEPREAGEHDLPSM